MTLKLKRESMDIAVESSFVPAGNEAGNAFAVC
jgi:hypothetical protein